MSLCVAPASRQSSTSSARDETYAMDDQRQLIPCKLSGCFQASVCHVGGLAPELAYETTVDTLAA